MICIERMDEAAVFIAQSPDSKKALKEARSTLETLLMSLRLNSWLGKAWKSFRTKTNVNFSLQF